MQPIECEIFKRKIAIQNEITSVSISKLWEKMILDLTAIYGEQAVAKYCPQFNSVDSGFINKKAN